MNVRAGQECVAVPAACRPDGGSTRQIQFTSVDFACGGQGRSRERVTDIRQREEAREE